MSRETVCLYLERVGKSETVDEIVPGVCFYSPFSPTIYSHYSHKPGKDGRKRGKMPF